MHTDDIDDPSNLQSVTMDCVSPQKLVGDVGNIEEERAKKQNVFVVSVHYVSGDWSIV